VVLKIEMGVSKCPRPEVSILHFLKTVNKLCFTLTKLTLYIEYFMHRIFNCNNKIEVGLL